MTHGTTLGQRARRGLLQLGDDGLRLGRGFGEIAFDACEVPSADHGQHAAAFAAFGQPAQMGRHVAVALVDYGAVQRLGLLGELAEGGFEHVALLQALDLGLVDLLARQHAGKQAADHLGAAPPRNRGIGPAQREADVAVYQRQRQAALQRPVHGGAQFGPGLDAVLLGDAHLVGAQCEAGRNHRHLPVADDTEQVEPADGVRIEHRPLAAFAQFDGDGVEDLAVEQVAHCLDAGRRDVGGAEQHDFDLTDANDAVRL
ncbi:MAG: hypothetical protein LPJ87_07705 [Zoogloeaceae bacterium]|nr:hypothetical protein [Zoogloeaceae bacterium]